VPRAHRFGFETSENMIHGLWVGPNAVTQDFLTVMYRIQALGFNAIRLPMSFQARAPPPAWRALRRPCECGLARTRYRILPGLQGRHGGRQAWHTRDSARAIHSMSVK